MSFVPNVWLRHQNPKRRFFLKVNIVNIKYQMNISQYSIVDYVDVRWKINCGLKKSLEMGPATAIVHKLGKFEF